jgi:hypothetical protein
LRLLEPKEHVLRNFIEEPLNEYPDVLEDATVATQSRIMAIQKLYRMGHATVIRAIIKIVHSVHIPTIDIDSVIKTMETLKDLYQPATAGTVHTNDTNSKTSALAARSAISSQRTRGGKHKRTASKMDTLEAQKDRGKPKKEDVAPVHIQNAGRWVIGSETVG